MLKFISSVDSSYEDSIYREFNIPKGIKINNNKLYYRFKFK